MLLQIMFEGWSKNWEDPKHGFPPSDCHWIKNDQERGMFGPVQTYRDIRGEYRKRRVLKTDRMWFYPQECPGVVRGSPPNPHSFFRSRVFFWRPVGVWGYSIRCPRSNCPAHEKKDVFLYRCGYGTTVRQICDIADWFSLLTEILSCGPCNAAAKDSTANKMGRFLATDKTIMSQLSEAHQAVFPAVLTAQ